MLRCTANQLVHPFVMGISHYEDIRSSMSRKVDHRFGWRPCNEVLSLSWHVVASSQGNEALFKRPAHVVEFRFDYTTVVA
jgi:hypothetical protein